MPIPAKQPTQAYPQQWRHFGLARWRPWWALVLFILLFAGFYAVLASLTHLVTLPEQPSLWLILLILLSPLMALIPTCRLAVRWGLGIHAGWLDSVWGRFRWRWCAQAWLMCLIALLPFLAIDMLWLDAKPLQPEPDWPWLLLLVLLLVPLQAAGEEYLFRGFLSQWLGQWFGSKQWAFWLPMLMSSLLFAWVHGAQDAALFSTRLGLGMLFFWLTWRSGGLEAAIALHAASNFLAFAQTLATGTTLSSLFSTEASWTLAIGQLIASILAALWLLSQQPPIKHDHEQHHKSA